MSSKSSYQAPPLSAFKSSFTCPLCKKFNETQDIRKTTAGKIYRICSHCHCTSDLHFPPETVVIEWKHSSRCASCACTDYRPVQGIECACGHLGSYHHSIREPGQTREQAARTMKSELIPGVYDASSHDDLI
ncbi:hypothetical protein FDP41_007396 [Naegleria fowleri]|uniref:Uncharacterized protein n=1 Tax=Naegleria fowleri TaxID=5763 RepID=A0A6A5CG03_NAEFO|nr:uncharacterized protein FDP41_007396 [Naegleria fowleri]KAF0984219.1 hypothetical protein FDP41_007396 [Naegleria fowleri]CAG4709916.1 unnamed protein product [Naegleria fowleri]